MNSSSARFGATLLLALSSAMLVAPTPAWSQATKPRIEKAADLPRFSYRIEGSIEELVRSADRFAPFSVAVRRDLQSVLDGYDIPDKATQRELMTQLAVLDFIDGRYEQAFNRAEQVRALQDKPADKLMSGLRLRAAATAARSHPVGSEAWKAAAAEFISREVAAMPFSVVANDVREIKAGAEMAGEGLVFGGLREQLQPMLAANNGMLSSEFAPRLLFARYALLATLPLKQTTIDTLGRILAANSVAKADIWAARDVALKPGEGRGPVRIAVWDSGVDTGLFPTQLLRDAKGQPLFIAFDKYARPSRSVLQPIPAELRGRLPAMKASTKGLSDLQSNIDSAEASDVKRLLSTLAPEKYKATVEELGLAGNYIHGTHVAGIALAGNPYARLVVGRIEFGHTLKPDPCPSLEGAKRDARAVRETIAFFRKQQVRVVNMSFGGSVGDVEGELEKCGIGRAPDERKALARQYFEIGKLAFTEAMRSAPEILFVPAAGNEGNDASFTEQIPSGIQLPNVLTVGAVDLAGDEAGFTSYGPTVRVHANGYQVLSDMPGGDKVALSGTSMSAPQVTNLAGKMLAVNPKLTPARLIELIVGTAERSADGRRVLIHPKKAVDAARAALAAG